MVVNTDSSGLSPLPGHMVNNWFFSCHPMPPQSLSTIPPCQGRGHNAPGSFLTAQMRELEVQVVTMICMCPRLARTHRQAMQGSTLGLLASTAV